MDDQPAGTSIWDAIRGWADSAGLLLPQDDGTGEGPGAEHHRPRVPQSVCDNCPICQGAATLEQVNPEIFTELTDVARTLISGVGSALAAATEQRLAGMDAGPAVPGEAPASGPSARSTPDDESDDPSI